MTERCTYCTTWEPETLKPTGPQCGERAVAAIVWQDGRVSPACAQHGVDALDDDARAFVVAVFPVERFWP